MSTGNIESTIVIFAVIIMNAILGTVQHFKAKKSPNSLKALSAPTTKVMLDGVKLELPSREVIPGDIVLLEAGDLVVADGRIIKNFSLQVNGVEIGDPTEVAFVNLVHKYSLDEANIIKEYKRLKEVPFDSDRKLK